MSDVAARAGVSQATVSFVLGGRHQSRISDPTRQRVLRVADELGYQRNQLARAMITGKSRILGVLVSPEAGENTLRMLTGAMEVASNQDYFLKVIHLSYHGVNDATIVRCREWRLAGAMVIGLSDSSFHRLNQEFRAIGLPMAMLDNAPNEEWGTHFRSDDDQGIREVVTHLADLGHRRIAFVGGLPSSLSDLREASFRASILEAGLSVHEHWIRQSSWSDQEIIATEVRALFTGTSNTFPTAVVCSADTIALVVQRIARAMGLRLPADLSITGYSDERLASYVDPALTTIDQSFQDMGRAATTFLIQCAEDSSGGEASSSNRDSLRSHVLLPARLIVRNSTAVAPPQQ